MKPEAIAAAESGARARPNSKVNDLFVLTKVRLNALVVATTAGGYYMAAPASVEPSPLLVACLGTALVASGAAAINQVNERDLDRLMLRTQRRPVADGRMRPAKGSASRSRSRRSGLRFSWLRCQPARGRRRAGDAADLRRDLHAAEAGLVAGDGRRRGARRIAAAHRLGGGARIDRRPRRRGRCS